jgi:hypothetical protein
MQLQVVPRSKRAVAAPTAVVMRRISDCRWVMSASVRGPAVVMARTSDWSWVTSAGARASGAAPAPALASLSGARAASACVASSAGAVSPAASADAASSAAPMGPSKMLGVPPPLLRRVRSAPLPLPALAVAPPPVAAPPASSVLPPTEVPLDSVAPSPMVPAVVLSPTVPPLSPAPPPVVPVGSAVGLARRVWSSRIGVGPTGRSWLWTCSPSAWSGWSWPDLDSSAAVPVAVVGVPPGAAVGSAPRVSRRIPSPGRGVPSVGRAGPSAGPSSATSTACVVSRWNLAFAMPPLVMSGRLGVLTRFGLDLEYLGILQFGFVLSEFNRLLCVGVLTFSVVSLRIPGLCSCSRLIKPEQDKKRLDWRKL